QRHAEEPLALDIGAQMHGSRHASEMRSEAARDRGLARSRQAAYGDEPRGNGGKAVLGEREIAPRLAHGTRALRLGEMRQPRGDDLGPDRRPDAQEDGKD